MPFLGEYECRVDDKGRLRLPTQLIRQLDGKGVYNFVISRGFEKCLVLYEKHVWDRIVKEIEGLNVYKKSERQFMRAFLRGASAVGLDSADRINLSNRQLEFAGIGKDAILASLNDRIEIWSPEEYDKMIALEPDDLSALAEEVLGSGFEKEEE